MDEQPEQQPAPEPEPIVPVPLSQLLAILWGYKKGAELRERAVPGQAIVELLRAVPNYEQWYHIQDPKAGTEGLSTVWQKDEWKGCGERTEQRDNNLRILWSGIDAIVDVLAPKFPMFSRENTRQWADGIIQARNWQLLQQLGVDTTELEKLYSNETQH